MAKLKKNFNDAKIISIDLPEALLLQSYYLHTIFPEKKFFLYEDYKNISTPCYYILFAGKIILKKNKNMEF